MTPKEIQDIAVIVEGLLPDNYHFALAIGNPDAGYVGLTVKAECVACMMEAIFAAAVHNGELNHACPRQLMMIDIPGVPS